MLRRGLTTPSLYFLKKMTSNKEPRLEIEATKSNCNIVITAYAYQKMRYLVDNVDAEVAWLSTVTRTGNSFILTEVYLPEQEVTASDVESSPEMMSSLVPEIIEAEGAEQAKDTIRDMRAFCHSHYTMGVFWSQKDESGIDGLGNSQFLVSLVLNRKGDILGRIDLFEPLRITLNKVPVSIDHSSESEELEAQIKAKVSKKSYVYTPKKQSGKSWRGYRGYGGYGTGLWDEDEIDELNEIIVSDKNSGNSRAPEVTSAFSLPPLLRNKHPELSDLCALANKAHGKDEVMRDLITLVVASHYENQTILDKKDQVKDIITELLDKPKTDIASPEVVFEIINIAEMWGDTTVVMRVKPEKIMKVSSYAALYTLLQSTYKIKIRETYCLRP